MNIKHLLIALQVLLLIALAACGLLPTTGPARTPQAGALPPATTTQLLAPSPAPTSDSGTLPPIPRTPTVTPPPSVCETYDDFKNRNYDGSINDNLWPKPEPGQAFPLSVAQHDGFLELSNERPIGPNDYTLALKRPGLRPVEQLLCFEAKLWLARSAHKGGFPAIKLQIISDQNDVSECRLFSPQPGGLVQFSCEFVRKYITPSVPAKYDTWHKARIEIRPVVDSKELIWNAYLDDALIGTFNTGTSQLYYAKFMPIIAVSYNSGDTVAASYFKDVQITPAK